MYRVIEGRRDGLLGQRRRSSGLPTRMSAAAIEDALSIAKEEKAPDLIIVPVPAPQGGRS